MNKEKEIIFKKEIHIYLSKNRYIIKEKKYNRKSNERIFILSGIIDIIYLQVLIDLPFDIFTYEGKVATLIKSYIPAFNNYIFYTNGMFYKSDYGEEHIHLDHILYNLSFDVDDENILNYLRYNKITNILTEPLVNPFE